MIQQEYWKEHTSTLDGATVEAMMLDSQVVFDCRVACLSGSSMQGSKGIFQCMNTRRTLCGFQDVIRKYEFAGCLPGPARAP